MFIKYIKQISLKKILRDKISNVKSSKLVNPIKSVGLLVDLTYFSDIESLIKDLNAEGIQKSDIKILAYKSKLKKNEVFTIPVFTDKNIDWKGNFAEAFMQEFMQTPFDLLIGYYDIENPALMVCTHQSKANFKVGFSAIDKRLFHLLISTQLENSKVFVHELFRYLKILNKI